MGQAANTGRRAELDDRKRRAAGRSNERSPEIEQIRDFQQPLLAKGATGGAFGAQGMANRKGGTHTQGGGGGGGAQSPAKASHLTTGRSTQSARKREA